MQFAKEEPYTFTSDFKSVLSRKQYKKKIRISYFIETKNGSKIHDLRHLYLSFLVEDHSFSIFGIIQSCLFCSLGLTLGKITHEDKIKGLLPKFTFKIFIYNKNKSKICIFLFFQTEISSYLDFVFYAR